MVKSEAPRTQRKATNSMATEVNTATTTTTGVTSHQSRSVLNNQ